MAYAVPPPPPLPLSDAIARQVTPKAVASADHRRLVGFLNTAEDLLAHLGHRILPHLPALLGLVLRVVELGVSELEPREGKEEGDPRPATAARHKELRTTGLRLVAVALTRFPQVGMNRACSTHHICE